MRIFSIAPAPLRLKNIEQSDLGYPTIPEPTPIRISDLVRYISYAQTEQVQ